MFQLKQGDELIVLVRRRTPVYDKETNKLTDEETINETVLITSRSPEDKMILKASLDYEWERNQSNKPNANDQQQIVIRMNCQ